MNRITTPHLVVSNDDKPAESKISKEYAGLIEEEKKYEDFSQESPELVIDGGTRSSSDLEFSHLQLT